MAVMRYIVADVDAAIGFYGRLGFAVEEQFGPTIAIVRRDDLTLWLAMRFSVNILKVIRESGVLLVTRIAGLLLSAIAVQMVADAVRAFAAGEG